MDIIGAPVRAAAGPAHPGRPEGALCLRSRRLRLSGALTGGGRTDAKDAYIIAETARIRVDLTVIDPITDLVRNLVLLTRHRGNLVADRCG